MLATGSLFRQTTPTCHDKRLKKPSGGEASPTHAGAPGLKAEPKPVLWVREVALEVPGTVGARLPALNLVARIFTYIVIFNVKNNNSEIFLDYANE